ncbi:hypothetical protein [Micromonospora thermarum]|uniref:CBM6 domain-containing protein n=1 Tax=Micromonospora thermarum TaxID=2720024 RepID=A0ABX0ZEX2_9ACTN|nr:hypothetical protein [Micromonospora thermarum]NJP35737.1 hypothetical protein [Micromonospora thermarum]
MRPLHGRDQDGVWRIGPVRLLAVVGVGYLIVVLALAALTAGVDSGSSADAGSGPEAGASAPESSTPAGPGEGTAGESAPVSPAGKDVRVGSVENRSAPPRPSPSPSTARPSVAPPPAAPPPPPVVTSYEAESPVNGLAGTRTFTCSGCSGEKKVGYIGRDMGALQFNGVTARTGGTASVTLTYVNGEGPRVGHISVNGGSPIVLTFPGTGGWSTVDTMTITVALRPGTNSLRIFNPHEPAPDFDKITVSVR